MIPAVSAVAFSCQDIYLVLVESFEQRLVIVELNYRCLDRTFLQKLIKDIDHRTVQNAYLLAI